ncbi:MAG TPA: YeeE/YedE thiosulfate transporter family protein [Anaeromyxobacteraceae bacterium]|nr:YeeE/YedE thiosulfate transporter family protein [Anaeromyxobacteraceae bacterium]
MTALNERPIRGTVRRGRWHIRSSAIEACVAPRQGETMERSQVRFWNPYVGGVALGLVLLATYALMGRGLGASGASFRAGVAVVHAIAPRHAEATPAMASTLEDGNPLDDWLVVEVLGLIVGGFIGAATSGRLRREVAKGPTFGSGRRLALALVGGVLMGFAAKLARGCTSGQGLSGGALMSVGAWAFMLSVFAGGYGVAYLVRRQWR